MIPIPQSVEASTHKSKYLGGPLIVSVQGVGGVDSIDSHHLRSLTMEGGGWCDACLAGNCAMKLEKFIK
jgi:hypothetical protein